MRIQQEEEKLRQTRPGNAENMRQELSALLERRQSSGRRAQSRLRDRTFPPAKGRKRNFLPPRHICRKNSPGGRRMRRVTAVLSPPWSLKTAAQSSRCVSSSRMRTGSAASSRDCAPSCRRSSIMRTVTAGRSKRRTGGLKASGRRRQIPTMSGVKRKRNFSFSGTIMKNCSGSRMRRPGTGRPLRK